MLFSPRHAAASDRPTRPESAGRHLYPAPLSRVNRDVSRSMAARGTMRAMHGVHRRTWLAGIALLAGALSVEAAGAPGGPPDWARHPVNRWVRQSPREGKPAPDFPYEGSGAYDPVLRKWIHHGGHDGIPQGFHTFTFDL